MNGRKNTPIHFCLFISFDTGIQGVIFNITELDKSIRQ